MASDEVVDFSTFALHSLAGSLEIKIPGSQNDVGKNFEELNHGGVSRHGHHGVEHVAGLGHTEIRSGIVHLDFTGGGQVLI